MAEIVAGEFAATQGRFEHALAAYQRACTIASENQALSMLGLAYVRMARLAHRRGHMFMANAAFETAIATYEAWGAKGLAARLRQIGIGAI